MPTRVTKSSHRSNYTASIKCAADTKVGGPTEIEASERISLNPRVSTPAILLRL